MELQEFTKTWNTAYAVAEKFAGLDESEFDTITDDEWRNAEILVNWAAENKLRGHAIMTLAETESLIPAVKAGTTPTSDSLEIGFLYPAVFQEYTVELLHKVGRHLAGKAVNISFEKIDGPTMGSCWGSDRGVNILIDTGVAQNHAAFFETFLHEVAHAKLHCTNNSTKAAGPQDENEANYLMRRWSQCATANMDGWTVPGARTQAAHIFHQKLNALLASPGAANFDLPGR